METRRPTHIFIVENNKYFVNLLDYIFSKNLHYRFLDFKTGEDCLRSIHLNPQIIVLDVALPGMNGFETLQEIVEQNPEVRVIMLIGENDRRLPAQFLNAGAADYVLKDGNENLNLITKIEDQLAKGLYNISAQGKPKATLRKKLYYALLLIAIASAGLFYYQ